MHFVYILYSVSADRYYVGQTANLDYRLQCHNRSAVTSTKAYVPWELKHSEAYETRSEAMRREREIKARKSRRYSEELNDSRSVGRVPVAGLISGP
jgi:putative endonuclease